MNSISSNKEINLNKDLIRCSVSLIVCVGLCALTSLTLYSKCNPHVSSLSSLGKAYALGKGWIGFSVAITALATLAFAVYTGKILAEKRKRSCIEKKNIPEIPLKCGQTKPQISRVRREILLKVNQTDEPQEVENLNLSPQEREDLRKFAKDINKTWNLSPNRLLRFGSLCHEIGAHEWSFLPDDLKGISLVNQDLICKEVSYPFNLLFAVSSVSQTLTHYDRGQKQSEQIVHELFKDAHGNSSDRVVIELTKEIDQALDKLQDVKERLDSIKNFVNSLKENNLEEIFHYIDQIKKLDETQQKEIEQILLDVGVILKEDRSLSVSLEKAPTHFGLVVLSYQEPTLENRELFSQAIGNENWFDCATICQKSFNEVRDRLKKNLFINGLRKKYKAKKRSNFYPEFNRKDVGLIPFLIENILIEDKLYDCYKREALRFIHSMGVTIDKEGNLDFHGNYPTSFAMVACALVSINSRQGERWSQFLLEGYLDCDLKEFTDDYNYQEYEEDVCRIMSYLQDLVD